MMVAKLIAALASIVIAIISSLGYLGVFLAMLLESALIPLPSEVIMPFAGYLVFKGQFNLYMVSLVGALGNLCGSLIAYDFGYWGHDRVVRPFVKKWGRLLLLSEEEYDKATQWVKTKSGVVSFTSRLLPGVRTVISLPIGVARYDLKKFIFYTFSGALIWSFILALIGKILGEHWNKLGGYFHKLDVLILLFGTAMVGYYIYQKLYWRKKIKNG